MTTLTGKLANEFVAACKTVGNYSCYTKGLTIFGVQMAIDGNPHLIVNPNGTQFKFGRVIPYDATPEQKAELANIIRNFFPDEQ